MQGAAVVSGLNPREELTALIGRNMRFARRLAGMSQADVVRAQATVLGPGERPFGEKELGMWENGHRRPSDGYLTRFALIVGQALAFFYEPHDDPGA